MRRTPHIVQILSVANLLAIMFMVMLVVSGGSIATAADDEKSPSLPAVAKPGTGGYVSGELIYALEGRQTPECHASTIVETPTGFVAAWFGGKHEKNPDVGIWLSRHDGESWSRPTEIVNGSEGQNEDFACWNPVLFQPKQGPLMLFYKVGVNPQLWWGMLVTSKDGGKTWSDPQKLGVDEGLGKGNPNLIGPVKNKPIQLDDGSILCPSSSEHDGWRVHFELTKDFGKTWTLIGPINDASKFNAIQPSILRYANGKMQVLCRTKEKVVAQSWSDDGGKTWGPLSATKLPNPNAGTDAITLKDGRQLLVYNHTGRGGVFPSGRNMLNVGLSKDGQSWTTVLTLERDRGEYSYPAIIQAADGQVHIVYTWRRQSVKHVVIDPASLKK
jgi:predicted neuraminidase